MRSGSSCSCSLTFGSIWRNPVPDGRDGAEPAPAQEARRPESPKARSATPPAPSRSDEGTRPPTRAKAEAWEDLPRRPSRTKDDAGKASRRRRKPEVEPRSKPSPELVLGSATDQSPGGYQLEVQLDQKGAGVCRSSSSRYEAEFDDRPPGQAEAAPAAQAAHAATRWRSLRWRSTLRLTPLRPTPPRPNRPRTTPPRGDRPRGRAPGRGPARPRCSGRSSATTRAGSSGRSPAGDPDTKAEVDGPGDRLPDDGRAARGRS